MQKRDPKTARLGHEILPFEMGYLPEYFQKKAEIELRETPENIRKGLKILREMMENKWNPEEIPVEDVKRMIVIFILQSLRDPMNQVNGFKVIFDVKSNPIKHIRHATPSNLHLMYYGTHDCGPGRFPAIHIINQSLTFKAAWIIVKPFLSAKHKSRFHFHETGESLLDFFPAACLPAEYGGELTNYDMTEWLRDVMKPEKLETLGGGSFNEK